MLGVWFAVLAVALGALLFGLGIAGHSPALIVVGVLVLGSGAVVAAMGHGPGDAVEAAEEHH